MKVIKFPGMTGPTYTLLDPYAAVETCINFFTITNENRQQDPTFDMELHPSPGNKPFSPLPSTFASAGRGLFEYRNQCYGVNGTTFFHISSTGVMTSRGTVANDSNPCTFAANYNNQIFICSANKGYIFNTATLAFTDLTGNPDFLGAQYVTFQDGYFIVANPFIAVAGYPATVYPNQIQISGDTATPVGDGTVWDAANISAQAGQSDYLRAVISTREYVRIAGARRSQVFVNVGNAGIGEFPFQTYNNTYIETGIAAPWSLCNMGESLIWIGQDERGVRACWRDPAFNPQRVSTYSVEALWNGYARVDDAICFSFLWYGHLFYQITFPTANATWVYDATESDLQKRPIWHQRTFNGVDARPERFHAWVYGKHLVQSAGGDGYAGAVYEYDLLQFYDTSTSGSGGGVDIVRERTVPHIRNGYNRIIYDWLEFACARGTGTVSTPAPVIELNWSDDGGRTFASGPGTATNSFLSIEVGAAGDYSKRVFSPRLGYSRDRVYRIRCRGRVAWAILGCDMAIRECAS